MLLNASLLLCSKANPMRNTPQRCPAEYVEHVVPYAARWPGDVFLCLLTVSQRILWELEGFDGSVAKDQCLFG